MIRLADILTKVEGYHPTGDMDLIKKAYVYAARAHEGQTRRSGDPYVVHPLSVASIITDLRLDVPSVCAGLLHDSVEDTSTTVEELQSLFGNEVAFLVDGVTKLGKTAWTTCARSTTCRPRSRSGSRARRWTSTRRSPTASASCGSSASSRTSPSATSSRSSTRTCAPR